MIIYFHLRKVVLKVVTKPAASVAPGNLLEMQIIRPHPSSIKSGMLGMENIDFVSTSPPSNSDAHEYFRITSLK